MAKAFSLKVVKNGALMLLLCFLVLQGVSGFVSLHGCSHTKTVQNRKADLKENNEEVKGSVHVVGWELRTVPSGPDPLHHNGGNPKKPKIDP